MIFKVFCINLIECVCLTNELIKLNAALFAHLVVHEKRQARPDHQPRPKVLKRLRRRFCLLLRSENSPL